MICLQQGRVRFSFFNVEAKHLIKFEKEVPDKPMKSAPHLTISSCADAGRGTRQGIGETGSQREERKEEEKAGSEGREGTYRRKRQKAEKISCGKLCMSDR